MKNSIEARIGVFVILAFMAGIFIIEMVGGFESFRSGYRIRGRFNNVQELKIGDAVKMSGKQIGRVDKIEFSGNQIEVTFKINDTKAAIKTDSKATIKFMGLMGQNYVSIGFGSPQSPKIEAGNEITTLEQTDLASLMAKIENVAAGVEGLTTNFSSPNFNNLLGTMSDVLKENRERISMTLSNLHQVSSQVAQGKGTVGKLIQEESLYQSAMTTVTNLNDTAADIRNVISEAKGIVSQVSKGEGTIGKFVNDESFYKDMATAAINLREIMEKINRGQGSVGKLVNDEALYKNVRMTLQKLDKATEGLEDQGPLSVLGIAVNSLF